MSEPRIVSVEEAQYLAAVDPMGLPQGKLCADFSSLAHTVATEPERVAQAVIDHIDPLANFIMGNIPGEPSQSQGAVETAVRLLGTEPDRVKVAERLAAARALRSAANDWSSPEPTAWLLVRADEIENGTQW